MTDEIAWVLFSIGLLFVLEGFFPAISPDKWKVTILKIISFDGKKIRFFGIGSMFFGAIIIAIVHQVYKV